MRFPIVAGCVFACLSLSLDAADRRVPTHDDIVNLARVGSPALSPDGARVAYTVRRTNWDDNAFDTDIWMVDVATRQARQITRAKKSSSAPAFSPDATRLAFVSDRDGKRQIYVLSLDGGEAEAVTTSDTGVNAFDWAPDGTRIAFTQADAKPAAMKARDERDGEYEIVEEDRAFAHLHVVDLATRKVERLTSGDFVVGSFEWSPDATRLAFDHAPTSRPGTGTDDISIVHAADRRVTALVTQPGPDTHPVWSPDGRSIAFETTMSDPAFYYANGLIATIPSAGGTIQVVTRSFDEDANLVAWSPAGILFQGLARTWSYLHRVDPTTTKVERLGPAAPVVDQGFAFSRDFATVAFTRATATSIADIAVAPLATMRATILTTSNAQLDAWTLGTRELITWTSQDGASIEGVLHKPADFVAGKRYPLLVVIHGGPTGTSRPVPFGATGVYPIDMWVARGALVLEPNYRGSAGYGAAFRALNVRNLGVGDAWDVLSGIDHLVAQGLVDRGRVGAMGWSQGGYISAFLTTHHSDRFKAISVGAGISNWMTYYANTDITPFTRQYLKATPWDDPAIYATTSPMTAVIRATTPTLIQHGERDLRVPAPNAYELFRGLQDRQVPSRLIVYKGFGHGLTRPRAQRAALEHNTEWFEKYFWTTPAPTAGER